MRVRGMYWSRNGGYWADRRLRRGAAPTIRGNGVVCRESGSRNKDVGHEVVVYANGESKLPLEVRWLYPQSLWPLTGDFAETLTEINHTAWEIRDAADFCDVIHVNSVHGLPPSRFCRSQFVYTIHHGHDQTLSEFYSYHHDVHFVTLSNFQQRLEAMPQPAERFIFRFTSFAKRSSDT